MFNLSQAADHDLSTITISPGVTSPRWNELVRRCWSAAEWRFAAHPVGWRQDLYAATLGVRAVASHFSAAALLGIDGLAAPPKRSEILCHHAAPVDVGAALVRRSRFLPKNDVVVVDGIPCTTLARAVCDLASLVDEPQLVRMIDDIQRRGASMAWLMQRATKLNRAGRRGPPEVLDIVRRRLNGYRVPDWWFERLLERCLESPILGHRPSTHTARRLWLVRRPIRPRFALGSTRYRRAPPQLPSRRVGERYDEDRDIRSSQQGWEIAYLGFAATKSPTTVCRDIETIVQRRASDLCLRQPEPNQQRLSLG